MPADVGLFAAFSNYAVNTRVKRASGPRDFIQEKQLRNYPLLALARSGNGNGMNQVAGKGIEDTVQLGDFSNTRAQKAGSRRQPTRGGTDSNTSVSYRFIETDRPIKEREIKLNKGSDGAVKWKDLLTSIKNNMMPDHANYIERRMAAVPDADSFTLTREDLPIPSIFSYITESGVSPPEFTNVQGINPATVLDWRHVVEEYDHTKIEDETEGLFAAFDRVSRLMSFENPQGISQWFQSQSIQDFMILTNGYGRDIYQQLCRKANFQALGGRDDPSYGAHWRGIPVQYCAAFDAAPLEVVGVTPGVVNGIPQGTYANGTRTGAPWPKNKPRYVFIKRGEGSFQFYFDEFMEEKGPLGPDSDRPDATIMYLQTFGNLFARSRKRSFAMIRPRG